jgi:hypothetical protein
MEQGDRPMKDFRAGFTPLRAGLAFCAVAVVLGGGLTLASGPAQTEQTTKVSLSTVSNARAPNALDQASLDEAARAAALQKLAEVMRRKAAEEKGPAQPAIAATTTGSAASATISGEIQTDAASTQTGGAKVSPTVSQPMQVAAIAPEDMQRLAGKAASAIRNGDIAGARLVLEHAARAGDATALYALAETYDPRVLVKLRVQGMTGDPATARDLYRKALDSGVEDARGRLSEGG